MKTDRIEEANRLLEEYYASEEYERDREKFEEYEFFEAHRAA